MIMATVFLLSVPKRSSTNNLHITHTAKKLAYYGHTMKKQGSCLEKEIMQGTMPGAHR